MEGNTREGYVEVLFEYKGSRKVLYLRPSQACECVQEELRCMGLTNAVVTLSVLPETTDCYFLQKWHSKWKTFVDVDSTDQVVESDRLSVVHNPVFECNEVMVSYLLIPFWYYWLVIYFFRRNHQGVS